MKKLRFLIASGPTREPLDPVRFLSNYSTGVMGKYLVGAARKRGHRVRWVRSPEDAGTAAELLSALKRFLKNCDVLVMASAVCDVRPRRVSASKIKKKGLRTIRLKENPDLLKTLAQAKRPRQIFIGFALESSKVLENAREKLRAKKLDAILAQKVARGNMPFGEKPVDATLLDKYGRVENFRSLTKKKIAGRLIKKVETLARWPSS